MVSLAREVDCPASSEVLAAASERGRAAEDALCLADASAIAKYRIAFSEAFRRAWASIKARAVALRSSRSLRRLVERCRHDHVDVAQAVGSGSASRGKSMLLGI